MSDACVSVARCYKGRPDGISDPDPKQVNIDFFFFLPKIPVNTFLIHPGDAHVKYQGNQLEFFCRLTETM